MNSLPPLSNIYSSLILNDYVLSVNLGVPTEERSEAQEIKLNLIIKFPKLLAASKSDNIDDAICYKKLTDAIYEFCNDREFHLIEYMGLELYKFIKQTLPQDYLLWLSITKNPPIANLASSDFTIGDWDRE